MSKPPTAPLKHWIWPHDLLKSSASSSTTKIGILLIRTLNTREDEDIISNFSYKILTDKQWAIQW